MKCPFFISLLQFFFLFTSISSGQEVSGIVTAFKTVPLNNVSVKSLKTEKKVTTDTLGRFSIEIIPDDVILISAAGFSSHKIRIGKTKEIKADLKYKYSETSYNEAVENKHISPFALDQALKKYPGKRGTDYSQYQDIYALIRSEINSVRVDGRNVYSIKAISFSMSPQVLYDVDNVVISDISFIIPGEVVNIEYLEGAGASAYGMRGANGVIKITLRK